MNQFGSYFHVLTVGIGVSFIVGIIGGLIAVVLAVLTDPQARYKVLTFFRTFGLFGATKIGMFGEDVVPLHSGTTTQQAVSSSNNAVSGYPSLSMNWAVIRRSEAANTFSIETLDSSKASSATPAGFVQRS